ncbi:hypothetical protein M0R04_08680 [Candidatus Dojkabacteria bacterium]|jgi:hypothetical protein|nr:hypothetical protein [Candidatus Dojkabacteria bacterium]
MRYNNKDLIKAFINENITEGEGSNVIVKDNILYSYGNHFPLLIRLTDDSGELYFIVNKDKYSPTTSRHQRIVFDSLNVPKEKIFGIGTAGMIFFKVKEITKLKEAMALKIDWYNE